MDPITLQCYHLKATEFAEQYRQARSGIISFFPEVFPGRGKKILDIGCGSGRDLHFLLEAGHDVRGLEPAEGLRREAEKAYPALRGRIFPFGLPFPEGAECGQPFDGILCAAVFMHIHPDQLTFCAQSINGLLKAGGDFLLSFSGARSNLSREFRSPDGRVFYPHARETLVSLFCGLGLTLKKSWDNADALGREELTWHTCHFAGT